MEQIEQPIDGPTSYGLMEQADDLSDQQERSEELDDLQESLDRTFPTKKTAFNLYELFKMVLKEKEDHRKIGCIKPDTEELGMADYSIRGALHVAAVASLCGKPSFANFFKQNSEDTLTTSLSKRGYLLDRFVTQHKIKDQTPEYYTNAVKKQSFLSKLFGGGSSKPMFGPTPGGQSGPT